MIWWSVISYYIIVGVGCCGVKYIIIVGYDVGGYIVVGGVVGWIYYYIVAGGVTSCCGGGVGGVGCNL